MTPNDGSDIAPAGAGHLTPEQLDDLAARASADLDPDQVEDRTDDLATLEVHLAGCAACRAALGDQVEVSAWLRRAPTPGPMPGDVVARLDAALAGAAAARATTRVTGGSPSSDGDSRGSGHNVLPMSDRRAQGSLLGRLAESRATKSLVAAAAVVLIGAGGFAALHRNNGGPASADSGASAGTAKAAAVPPSALAGVPVEASGTKYTTANITDEVKRQLAAGGAKVSAPQLQLAGPDATTLTTPSGLAACLTALNASAARPLLVDLATYNGKPAAVLVLPGTNNGRELWVVSRTCAPDGKDGTLLFKPLG